MQKDRIKVLYVIHETQMNGASKSLLEIIERLRNKYTIYVLSFSTEGELISHLKKLNVKIIIAPYYRWCEIKNTNLGWIKKRIYWQLYRRIVNYISAIKVSRICIKEKIAIIHTNSSVVNIGGIISKLTGIKHVWHIREFADLDFNMYPLIKPSSYYTFMNSNANYFIFNSKAVSNHYKSIDKNKKKVVYNGVSLNNRIDENEKIAHDGFNILISGRVSKTKGQDQAIKACEILWNKGYKSLRLLIAGNGDVSDVYSGKIPQFVKVLGNVSEMTELRKNIDLELVCSKAEAFGRVTIEAMMGGIPVIGSNTGGTVELINPGENGYLYEYGDFEDLSNKIEKLIVNKDLRNQLGHNAQEYAINNFSIERCANNIIDVYRCLL